MSDEKSGHRTALAYQFELTDECSVTARYTFETNTDAQLFLAMLEAADKLGYGIVIGFEKSGTNASNRKETV